MSNPCPYCTRYMIEGDPKRRPSKEHVIPKSKAKGKHFNKIITCLECNQDKGDKTIENYLAILRIRQIDLKNSLDLTERRVTMIDYLIKCGLK